MLAAVSSISGVASSGAGMRPSAAWRASQPAVICSRGSAVAITWSDGDLTDGGRVRHRLDDLLAVRPEQVDARTEQRVGVGQPVEVARHADDQQEAGQHARDRCASG